MRFKLLSSDLQYTGWVRYVGESVFVGWKNSKRTAHISITDASLLRLRIALAVASHNYGLSLRLSHGLDYIIRGLSIEEMIKVMIKGYEHSKKISDDEYLAQALEEAKLTVGRKEEEKEKRGED